LTIALRWLIRSYSVISREVPMSGVARFGVSIDSKLIRKFDALIERKGYRARSEALRDLIRDRLVEEEWEGGGQETVGTITIVYNHHTRELDHALTDLQHQSYHQIISALHVHLDAHNCLEVLVVRGKSRNIRKIADGLIGTRGVKHGKLTMTTTGKELV
jgi:CopG family nickel-responsive transcriptional regulator